MQHFKLTGHLFHKPRQVMRLASPWSEAQAHVCLPVYGAPWWVLLQHSIMLWRLFFIVECGNACLLWAMHVFEVRASSSSPRLPLSQISFLSWPQLTHRATIVSCPQSNTSIYTTRPWIWGYGITPYVCLLIHSLHLYSLRLSTEGWPGLVDMGDLLYAEMVYLSADGHSYKY